MYQVCYKITGLLPLVVNGECDAAGLNMILSDYASLMLRSIDTVVWRLVSL